MGSPQLWSRGGGGVDTATLVLLAGAAWAVRVSRDASGLRESGEDAFGPPPSEAEDRSARLGVSSTKALFVTFQERGDELVDLRRGLHDADALVVVIADLKSGAA